MEDYTPLLPEDKRKMVSLRTVSDTGLKDGETLKIAGAEMSLPAAGEDIVFSGTDVSGKRWTLTKHYYGLGTSFFTADLDLNGVTDIILLQATGGCGIAPPAVLTVLLFDKQQRPFPMEVSGYFHENDNASKKNGKTSLIDDIITVGADKHAVLVCNQLDSAELKGRNGSYWRILMYRANKGRWERLLKYREKSLPMLVRYTNKPNFRPIPNPIPALKNFDDGAFTSAQEKQCKGGVMSDIKVDEYGRIESMKIASTVYPEPSSWNFFQPFVIVESEDQFEVLSLESRRARNILKENAKAKTQVRYTPPSMPGKLPLYFWITDSRQGSPRPRAD